MRENENGPGTGGDERVPDPARNRRLAIVLGIAVVVGILLIAIVRLVN
jgi:hypothetical protein